MEPRKVKHEVASEIDVPVLTFVWKLMALTSVWQALNRQVVSTAEDVIFKKFPQKVSICGIYSWMSLIFYRSCSSHVTHLVTFIERHFTGIFRTWLKPCKTRLHHSIGLICIRLLIPRFILLHLHLEQRNGSVLQTTPRASVCKTIFPLQSLPIQLWRTSRSRRYASIIGLRTAGDRCAFEGPGYHQEGMWRIDRTMRELIYFMIICSP